MSEEHDGFTVERVEYQHFYTTGNEPRLTACYLRVKEDDRYDAWSVVGLALCSSSDNPWKKRGRAIAYERAMKNLREPERLREGSPGSLPIRSSRGFGVLVRVNVGGFYDSLLFKSFSVIGHDFRFPTYSKGITDAL